MTSMTLNGFTQPSLIEGNSKHVMRRGTVRKHSDHGHVPWAAYGKARGLLDSR